MLTSHTKASVLASFCMNNSSSLRHPERTMLYIFPWFEELRYAGCIHLVRGFNVKGGQKHRSLVRIQDSSHREEALSPYEDHDSFCDGIVNTDTDVETCDLERSTLEDQRRKQKAVQGTMSARARRETTISRQMVGSRGVVSEVD